MILVYKLNIEQKELLLNQTYDNDSFFNPIQDIDNNWIISFEEVENCTNSEFQWVKTLQTIEYKAKETTINV